MSVAMLHKRSAASATFGNEQTRANLLFAAMLVLQATYLFTISYLEIARGALTADMQWNTQGVFLIGHGHLDPMMYSSASNIRYRVDHGEYIMYFFAPFTRILPTVVVLKYAQDLAVLISSSLVWAMLSNAIGTVASSRQRWVVRGLALVLLLLNPWTYWANAFDVHVQDYAVPFVVATIFFSLRRQWALALVMTLGVCGFGDVACTYGVGTGISLLLWRGTRSIGAAVVASSLAAFEMIHLIAPEHANNGITGTIYSYYLDAGQNSVSAGLQTVAVSALRHPLRVLGVLASSAENIFANVATTGLIGWLHPLAIGITGVSYLESGLVPGSAFSQPGDQNAATYPVSVLGTLFIVIYLMRRMPRAATVFACFAAINTCVWAAVFFPLLPARWVRMDAAQGAELRRIYTQTPPTNQVLVTQGSVGLFAARQDVLPTLEMLWGVGQPVPTDIVLTPYTGINYQTPTETAGQLRYWIYLHHARVLSHRQNIWHLRIPRYDIKTMQIGGLNFDDVPAWALRSEIGSAVLNATSESSYIEATESAGLVVDGGYAYRAPGGYRLSVRYSSSVPLIFEVFEPYGHRFIVREALRAHPSEQTSTVNVFLRPFFPSPEDVQAGRGPIHFTAVAVHAGQGDFELRIYKPKGGWAKVYGFTIRPI